MIGTLSLIPEGGSRYPGDDPSQGRKESVLNCLLMRCEPFYTNGNNKKRVAMKGAYQKDRIFGCNKVGGAPIERS